MQVNKLFQQFNKVKALIVGDVMIDAYLFGNVTRISPEAPVPVIETQRKESRLGGAANVALNLKSLGAQAILCSVVGNDAEGKDFIQIMHEMELPIDGICLSNQRITTVKTRLIAQNHQMIRIDSEQSDVISKIDESQLWKRIQLLLPQCQVVIFEDYDKGVLSPGLIQKIVKLANQLSIPTIVDPKKNNFSAYKGVSVFKPNLKELREGTKMDIDIINKVSLEKACQYVIKHQKIQSIFVTLSEHGAVIGDGKKFQYVPAHIRKIADVSGAGDTVVSVAALCLACKVNLRQMAELANLAGGLVCEEVGVVPINKKRLIDEANHVL